MSKSPRAASCNYSACVLHVGIRCFCLPEFLAGCIAGYAFLRMRESRSGFLWTLLQSQSARNALVVFFVLVILIKLFTAAYDGPSRWLWLADNATRFAYFTFPFAGIVFVLAVGRTFVSPWLKARWMILLGEASYAPYITHWTGQSLLNNGFLGASSLFKSLVLIAVSVLVSIVVFKLIEVSSRALLRGSLPSPAGLRR